ncbi:MAG: ABC transporter substrate-binding protein [Betaproteobacteria bacterium]|nr:ABC transporter substrate-binding protein [Betaproteobacteria bacterium]
MSAFRRTVPALVALSLAAAVPALAQTLRIALSSEPTSVDPHYHVLAPNNALAAHIYDGLTDLDEQQRVIPGLATSWKNDGGARWTFQLRKGVKFSNGKPFTADDVIYTFCRVEKNETSIAGGNKLLIRNIKSIDAPDPHTLVVTTVEPEPLLPRLLGEIGLISASTSAHGKIAFNLAGNCGVTGPWPTVTQFNEGSVAIGTGPFKLKSYVRGSAIELVRNDDYWGEKSPWQAVKFVPVTNAGPRLAGLIAGDYDVIENPAARDLGRLKDDKRFAYEVTPSSRVIFFQLDVARSPSPTVSDGKGGNPLQDPRVRKAMSMAIDRDAIAKRIMDGGAQPAYQFLPTGMYGTLPNPPVIRFDPAAARKLLAEAGYAGGFDITLSATNDRYINDGQIAQAVAGYLSQVGIRTKVDAMTRAIYFPRRAKKEFSFSMGGWGAAEASSFLRYWAAAPDEKKTRGTSNYGGLDDPQLNELVGKALSTMDDEKRAEILRQALSRLLETGAFIPLHFESTIWAHRADLVVKGRTDQYTLAMSVAPAKK